MDDRTLISNLLKFHEITHTSRIEKSPSGMYIPIQEAILNKWTRGTPVDISIEKFERLKSLGVIEAGSGNFDTGERHYIIRYDEDMLKSLKNLVRATTNTEFESIFREILLKYERKLKLDKINKV